MGDGNRTNRAKPRLPGWDGGKWTTLEPWVTLIDTVHTTARTADAFANWFEKWLSTNFDIRVKR